MVTVLLPNSEHVNVVGEIETVGLELQLSSTLFTTSEFVIVAVPLEFSATLIVPLTAEMLGAVLSTTVTVIVDVALFPLASVAVMVTVLLPKSEQLNVLWLYETFIDDEQLSVAVAVELGNTAIPLASRFNVVLLAVMVGAMLSTTLITFVVDEVLPAPSCEVMVTI